MEWMHFIFIFFSNYLHMSKKSSNFASKIVTALFERMRKENRKQKREPKLSFL